MNNKKGFTLIELLAVIVILAIIALIATPIILNVIEDAKKSAAVDSAYGYIEAIEFNNAMAQVDKKYVDKKIITDETLESVNSKIKVKGNKATKIDLLVITNNKVDEIKMCIGGYNVTYKDGKATAGSQCGSTSSGTENDTSDKEIVYTEDSIYTKAASLVYDTNGKCKSEGTYQYMDGCYIKGASTNNYVWYNGFMWRIMGINSDDTVRLITDENVTGIPYGSYGTAEKYATNEGYINNWLNDYFLSNLNSTKNIIKEGNYFCSETIGAELTDDTVRTECTSGKEVKAKVGLISYDEYYLASLSKSYLNIGQYFWTMTPKNASGTSYVWNVDNAGGVLDSEVINARGVRPVINVEANSKITKGEGTTSKYYVLKEDKNKNATGTLEENVTSGEYVKLEEKTYRVVSKDSDGIKLILDGYYDKTSTFGDNNVFSTSTIKTLLNGDVLTWLGNSEKIISTPWYQGDGINTGFKYTAVLDSTTNSVTAKVGLIRVGEMLSAQSTTIATKKSYWTINSNSKYPSRVWLIANTGGAASNSYGAVTNSNSVRPVIKVKSSSTINGGNGTWDNPYEI